MLYEPTNALKQLKSNVINYKLIHLKLAVGRFKCASACMCFMLIIYDI